MTYNWSNCVCFTDKLDWKKITDIVKTVFNFRLPEESKIPALKSG